MWYNYGMQKRYSKGYLEYLSSPAWRERRLAKLEEANFKCSVCGGREALDVHHLTYERFGNEDTRDLIALCRSCHWVADMGRPAPVTALSLRLIEKPVKPEGQWRKEQQRRKDRRTHLSYEERKRMRRQTTP